MTTVRAARPDDLEPMVDLLRLLFTIEEDFNFDAARQRQGLALLLREARACVLVAETEGRVVGMCTGQLVISTAEGGLSLLVEDLVIATDHRGKGMGWELMAVMARWAGAQGATRMQLLADRNNPPALSFYERIGWRTTALICLRRHL
jgi:ribosomal protein S18 acetylase RimI-like enzyme